MNEMNMVNKNREIYDIVPYKFFKSSYALAKAIGVARAYKEGAWKYCNYKCRYDTKPLAMFVVWFEYYCPNCMSPLANKPTITKSQETNKKIKQAIKTESYKRKRNMELEIDSLRRSIYYREVI